MKYPILFCIGSIRCYGSQVHGYLSGLLPKVLSDTAYSRTLKTLRNIHSVKPCIT